MDRIYLLQNLAKVFFSMFSVPAVLVVILFGSASVTKGNQLQIILDVCLMGCPFTAIQPAINAANTGDLIRVAQGVYTESIMVNKNITLQGGYSGPPEWQRNILVYVTVIDGNGIGSVVQVPHDFSPTIDGFTITGGNTTGDGGGIYVDFFSSPTLVHNTVINNRAARGGGIGVYQGWPVLSHNVVISNYATIYGGGIYMIQSTASISSNQIISNTTSGNGGGIFIDDYSSPVLVNNVVARNGASSNGGGIYIDFYSHPALVNNTIVANDLGPFWANEGIFIYNNSSPILINNIIATHSYGIRGIPLTITLDYNNIWSCTIACYEDVSPGLHDISVNPHFADPAGGDYHLECNSWAIDSATSSSAPSNDFEGDPRPLGYGIDIGADEYNGLSCTFRVHLPIVLRNYP